MNNQKIRVVRGPSMQDKTITTVVGSITIGTLVDKGHIPHHDPKQKASKPGYQRQSEPKRIDKIVRGIKDKRVDLPTAMLLNAREKPEDVLSGQDDNLILDVSRIKSLYVVDGQHRYQALSLLRDEEAIPASYKIPFVCMIGADYEQEMRQFYTVNSTAKSVKTDLSLRLMKDMVQAEEKQGSTRLRDFLSGEQTEWKVLGQDLAEKLNASSPMWRGRVRFHGEPKGQTVIPSTSMVASFQEPAKHSYFSGMKREHQLQILDAYWQGIQLVMPDAFSGGYEKYSIQKGLGVRAMHSVLPDVLERVRSGELSLFKPESYEMVLRKPLEKLSGESLNGERVSGAAFWREGKDGAVSTFNGSVGIRLLAEKIKRSLPPIEIPDIE